MLFGEALKCSVLIPVLERFEGRSIFPVSKITSCAFGGNDLSQLFVTSARVEINEEEEPLAGRVFVVEPGVTGLESNRYLL